MSNINRYNIEDSPQYTIKYKNETQKECNDNNNQNESNKQQLCTYLFILHVIFIKYI